MQEDSPNSLATPKPQTKKMSGTLMFLSMLVLAGISGIIFYGIFYTSAPSSATVETEKQEQAVARREKNAPLVDAAPQGGLAVTPVVTPDPAPQSAPSPNSSLPIAPVISPEIQQRMQQEMQMRQMRIQLELQALQAPLAVPVATVSEKKPSSISVNSSAALQNLNQTGALAAENEHKDKEAFAARASSSGWALPYGREPGADFALHTGTVIPGIMLSGINADLPGQVMGQVSRNVYDSATGKFLLIPQGSKLFGMYDSRVAMGQSRVLIAWNRIIFPDGSSITLGSMPGADQAGYAGFNDKTNNHYFRIFGTAVLMSMVSGGMGYAVDSLSGDRNADNPSFQDEMGSALATQLGQSSLQLLQQNATLKPTLEIRPGYRFNLVLVKDMVFDQPYAPLR